MLVIYQEDALLNSCNDSMTIKEEIMFSRNRMIFYGRSNNGS